MISVDLARSLRVAGLAWEPTSGDRFVIDLPDLADQSYVLSDLTIDLQRYGGENVLAFNGTVEWALDSVTVDQALWLLGPARLVSANLDWVELAEGRTDAGFVVTITHASGAHSHLSSSKVNRLESRELRLFGSEGSYVSTQTDVQAQAVFAGRRPLDDLDGWGYEIAERWGTLSTADGSRRVPSAQGAYADYYTRFAAAVSGTGPQPVPGAEAVATLAVLDAARISAAKGVTVALA